MLITVILFWVSLSILFFCYIGYGIILFLFNSFKGMIFPRKKEMAVTEWMPVTLVIPAYNEGMMLEQKVQNSLSLDYPADKLTIIVITDGSTDGSERIIQKYPSVRLLHATERRGKTAAIKRAMELVQTPIVIFSDANSMLNKESIQRITCHYKDVAVGGVAGEKRVIKHSSAVGEAEGIYWNYESFLKKQDADFYTVVGAAGELFSIRTELFPQLDDTIILDDFMISMKVCLQGYRMKYEPGAFAVEYPSVSLAEEEKRKVRITVGVYQSIGLLKKALNIFKHPLLCFQYISRRLLRWIFCPVMLIVLLVSNILVISSQSSYSGYVIFLSVQLLFYGAAIIGWLIIRSGKRAGVFAIPFYFVFMNYCLVKGFIKFLAGKQTVLWEKSLREPH